MTPCNKPNKPLHATRETLARDGRRCPQMFRVALLVVCFVPFVTHTAESVCYGTPSNGRLEYGVKIEESGRNFEPYSSLGVTLGRTYVHSRVARVITDAYAALAKELPNTMFVYGESGWSEGGRIKPHRTHQNGLAVDFMVPVRNKEGISYMEIGRASCRERV